MSQKKHFELCVQTKPYLKKYFQTLYGNPARNKEIVFTTDNLFGICIAASLFRPLQFHHRKELLKLRTDKFDARMDIHLPITFLTERRGGFAISDAHTITINKLFENRFEEDLWKFCLLKNIQDVETKDALEEFCQLYNIVIDEDITYEAIKKKEWRYRKKMKNSAPQLSRENFEEISVDEN
jgi:hypothetical protein